MIVKPLTEHHLEFLSLKGGRRGSSESTHVKKPHCWKSHVVAHMYFHSINVRAQLSSGARDLCFGVSLNRSATRRSGEPSSEPLLSANCIMYTKVPKALSLSLCAAKALASHRLSHWSPPI